MSSRQEELSELQKYIKEVDKEVTMILQSLQWDRKQLLQSKPKSMCKYDSNHKVPPEKLEEHEAKCVLKSQGYTVDDIFLPDVFDANSNTVLKLSSENIKDIINYASKTDPVFNRVLTTEPILLAMKRCDANVASEPQTLERLQATYTADERRAIYDAVIHSRPSCDQLADLVLGEVCGAPQSESAHKSRLQRLAELRDLRRRRAKYRVAARSRNYSHTLRGLIHAQMEMFTEAQGHTKSIKEEHSEERLDNTSDNKRNHREFDKDRKDTYDKDRRDSYSDNRRKRDYDDDRNSRKIEGDRSTEERGKEYDSYRRHERKRNTYREVEKNRHQSSTEEKGKHYSDRRQERKKDAFRVKIEKDVYQTSTEDRDKRYKSDRTQERKRDTYKEGMDSRTYDKSMNVDKNRIYIKKERDRSNSRDNKRYRESEREERHCKDRSSDRFRSGSEYKSYDSQYKKERAYSNHREKRKYDD